MKTHMLEAGQFIELILTHGSFWAKICNCLDCDYNCDNNIFISSVFKITFSQCFIPVMGKDGLDKLVCSQQMGLHSSVGRALQC